MPSPAFATGWPASLLLPAFSQGSVLSGDWAQLLFGCGPVEHADGEKPSNQGLKDCGPKPPPPDMMGRGMTTRSQSSGSLALS